MAAKRPLPLQDSLSLSRADRGQETILLVEDETNLRRLARQYLETQGYKILEAEDGAAALQIVDGYQGTIDLLLTDVVMPGMNGRELATQISKLLPEVRVLYMSGYTENAIGHDGMLDAGINLLQKPFSLPALKDRIREVLDSEPIPLEVTMSSPAGVTNLEKKSTTVPSSPFQPASPAALSPARRKELAAGDHRKYQPLGIALPGTGNAAAQRTTGNQPGAASRDCRTGGH